MIYINLILVIIALLFFFLSFYTPKQEVFFYFTAALLFLIAGISGFAGYSDLPISTITTYNATTDIATSEFIYTESDIFNRYIPLVEILISLYLFMTLIVLNKDGRRTE